MVRGATNHQRVYRIKKYMWWFLRVITSEEMKHDPGNVVKTSVKPKGHVDLSRKPYIHAGNLR